MNVALPRLLPLTALAIACSQTTEPTPHQTALGGSSLASASVADERPPTFDPAIEELIGKIVSGDRGEAIESAVRLEQRGEGLALAVALGRVAGETTELDWMRRKAAATSLSQLADPRTKDYLAKLVVSQPKESHFRTEAAILLAELGDPSATLALVDRLALDPLKVYKNDAHWQSHGNAFASTSLYGSDSTRARAVVALSELAMMNGRSLPDLPGVEEAVIGWARAQKKIPREAMAFLGAVRSSRAGEVLTALASPNEPLPGKGTGPPPDVFLDAESPLRFLGAARDEPSMKLLIDQLGRKAQVVDISDDGIQKSGYQSQGIALRAMAEGAVFGLAEWGDPRPNDALLRVIEDPTWADAVRRWSCEALAVTATEEVMRKVIAKLESVHEKKDDRSRALAKCLARTVALRTSETIVPDAIRLLEKTPNKDVRIAMTEALARLELDDAATTQLLSLVGKPAAGLPAAMALLLGSKVPLDDLSNRVGTPPEAESRAMTAVVIVTLRDVYRGDDAPARLRRWAKRVAAATDPKNPWSPTWAGLGSSLRAAVDDVAKPPIFRSWSRPTMRHAQLGAVASDPEGAVAALHAMGEKGSLHAIATEKGKAAKIAAALVE